MSDNSHMRRPGLLYFLLGGFFLFSVFLVSFRFSSLSFT